MNAIDATVNGILMGTHAEQEIFSQPETWRKVLSLYPQVSALLPRAGERVAFVGCGTSWFMSMSAAARREELGWGESDAFTASEFPSNRHYDRIVAISRSGTTTEVVDLLKSLEGRNTVSITAVADSPVARASGETIVLDFADEQSIVQTRYATAVLFLLRTHFGEDLTGAINQCQDVLDSDLSPDLVGADQISFLGTGWTIGLAQEAALKTRESAQFWAEAYPAMDYRHGPISIAQAGRAVWVFGEPPPGLIADIRATGAAVEEAVIDPIAHLVLAQRVAMAISQRRGLDADNPRSLARSIVLS
jgi:fructoselysine-6-P-deglycase FrlB-like protein